MRVILPTKSFSQWPPVLSSSMTTLISGAAKLLVDWKGALLHIPLVVLQTQNKESHAPTHSINNYCRKFFHWQGWTGLIASMIAETILQMRLYAMYFLDKKILCLMVGTFLLTSASAAAVINIAVNRMTGILPFIPFRRHFNYAETFDHLALSRVPLVPDMTLCIPMSIPPYIYAFWIPILAFETLLFCSRRASRNTDISTNWDHFSI
ncbi:hypothetical protein D9757_012725 [Collybiopsis confluens]|uniref:Uncharacterized protein n=1 Tax=Collybiopsis confluens TaxID=2823264 RepID=A0A8H5HFI9_9AGAR|nr:hypothetical protein D9757_012725 [Collybiopsis confluens]